MLQVTIPKVEQWDESKQEFMTIREHTLQLEHSLVSLSKWESKWCKPFLSKDTRTDEEMLDYIKCMTITQNVDPNIYNYIPNGVIEQINQYINAPMTATWFHEEKGSGRTSSEQITNELVYYWMIALNIPFECQKWHLNRLLTLVRICNIKNQPSKKMGKKDILSQNRALNAARRQRMNSSG